MHTRARIHAGILAATMTCLGTVPGCSRNLATGERQLNIISRTQEISLGQEAAREIAASQGLYDEAALQRYVESVGMKLAKVSERPDLPWSFKVVDDAAINAFALPGGPIFVTRGLLAHLENEAQLAIVLGHEIGHVTAEHALNQLSKAQLAGLGLGLGSLISEQLAGLGAAGTELLLLKFGRDDERQSDELALRYASRAGYDVRAAPEVFELLQRASAANTEGRLPGWLATHPDPEERLERVRERLQAMGPAELTDGVLAEERLLGALDGMLYGEDPREGVVRGNRFIHPALSFRVDFPAGFRIANGKQQVVAQDPDGERALGLTLAEGANEAAALRHFFRESGATQASEFTRVGEATVARFHAPGESGSGAVGGWVAFVRAGDAMFRLLMVAPAQTAAAQGPLFRDTLASFQRLPPGSIPDVSPQRIEVEKLRAPQSIRALQATYPAVSVDELARLNQLSPESVVCAGCLVKVVTGAS